jgi:hypothetical protein
MVVRQQPKTAEQFLALPIRKPGPTSRAYWAEEDTILSATDENGVDWQLAEDAQGTFRRTT